MCGATCEGVWACVSVEVDMERERRAAAAAALINGGRGSGMNIYENETPRLYISHIHTSLHSHSRITVRFRGAQTGPTSLQHTTARPFFVPFSSFFFLFVVTII